MKIAPVELKLAKAIQEFLIDRKIRNCTGDTLDWYEKRLRLGIGRYGDKLLSELTAADVRSIIADMMDEELAARTINGMLQATKALLNWAIEEGIQIGCDPRRLKALKEPKRVPKLLTEDQLRDLLNALDTSTFLGRRDHTMILTMLDTACRNSEVSGLDVESVDVPMIRVIGKGDKERLLALSPQCQREMLRWLRVRGTRFDPETGPLFPSRKFPHRLSRNRITKIVRRNAERAGIPFRVTPHSLRRQYASAFIQGGGSIVHLQQILGHSDITMSRRYARLFDTDCFESSMSLSPVSELKLK